MSSFAAGVPRLSQPALMWDIVFHYVGAMDVEQLDDCYIAAHGSEPEPALNRTDVCAIQVRRRWFEQRADYSQSKLIEAQWNALGMVVYQTFALAQYARELQVLWDFRFCDDDVQMSLRPTTQVASITSKGVTCQEILQSRSEDFVKALRIFLNEVGMIRLDDLYPAFSSAAHGKELELSRADMPDASTPELLRVLFGTEYIEFVHNSNLYIGLKYWSMDLDPTWYEKPLKIQHALTRMCLDHPNVFGHSLNEVFKMRFSTPDNILISSTSSFVTIEMLNMGRPNALFYEVANVDFDVYKRAEIYKVHGPGRSQIIYRDTIIGTMFSSTVVSNNDEEHQGTPEVKSEPGDTPGGVPQPMSVPPTAPQSPAEPIPEPAAEQSQPPAAVPEPLTSSQVPQRSQWDEMQTFGLVTGAGGMFSQAAEDGYTQSGGYD
ncbi:hypothetical protein YB2330_003013 [Saitoella coloradoensis]